VFVPWELENYPSAQVKMTYANSVPTPSNVLTATLNNFTPAFFMYNNGSVFIADAVDGVNCPAPYIIGPTCPATQGALVQFYVNGLGPVSNQPASGDPAPGPPNLAQTTTNPVIMIGGQQAQIQFSGLAPGFVGLYQVNATIPTGIGHGNQPITIAIGGQTSPGTITGGGTTYNIVLPIK
jgi:minor extracellular serine protease Vpr